MALSIHGMIDDQKCYAMVRDLRWPDGVDCPHCQSKHVAKNGHDTTEVFRQRYACRGCGRWFDDLTGTVFAGHHRPLKTWPGLFTRSIPEGVAQRRQGGSIVADACERPAKDDPADYRSNDCDRCEGLYRRIRHLQPAFAVGLSAPDGLPQQRRVRAGRRWRRLPRQHDGKGTSTRWRVFGRCYEVGCDRTEAFRRSTCHSIWPFLSSPTTYANVEEHCLNHSSLRWSNRQPSCGIEPSFLRLLTRICG